MTAIFTTNSAAYGAPPVATKVNCAGDILELTVAESYPFIQLWCTDGDLQGDFATSMQVLRSRLGSPNTEMLLHVIPMVAPAPSTRRFPPPHAPNNFPPGPGRMLGWLRKAPTMLGSTGAESLTGAEIRALFDDVEKLEANIRSQADLLDKREAEIKALKDERDQAQLAERVAKAERIAVYAERNKVVAALAVMARRAGWKCGIGTHLGETWEPDWRTTILIDLPTGQVSWHVHDSEVQWFAFLGPYDGKWDGHSTVAKYERLANLAISDWFECVPKPLEKPVAERIAEREIERRLKAMDVARAEHADALLKQLVNERCPGYEFSEIGHLAVVLSETRSRLRDLEDLLARTRAAGKELGRLIRLSDDLDADLAARAEAKQTLREMLAP